MTFHICIWKRQTFSVYVELDGLFRKMQIGGPFWGVKFETFDSNLGQTRSQAAARIADRRPNASQQTI